MPSEPIPLTLRAAMDADYLFLWDLNEITMRPHVQAISAWDHDVQQEQFRARFKLTEWRIIVAANGTDIGAYAVRRTKEMSVLTDLYLLPQYQRQGIGSLIVKTLLAEADSTKRPLMLVVLKSNTRAKELYERLGMRVIGEIGDQFAMMS
jgi:ribosomal protein S18 acetylase RimI-like enzyme